MNNKQRKLFNTSCKIEKLMYGLNGIQVFNKEVNYYSITINLGLGSLYPNFLTQLINLLNSEKLNYCLNYNEGFKLKIY